MVKIDINIDKRVFNERYLPAMYSDKRVKVIYGGSGSGKSYFIAQSLIYKILTVKGCNILAVRAVDNTLRISVFNLLKQIISNWGLDKIFKIRDTDMKISCINGNEIICKGMNDRENIKSITFTNGNLTDIWIEEASEIEKEDFQQLNLRLRGLDGVNKQIILSFNPISSELWIKKTFFDVDRNDTFILKTTYKDNKFIDSVYADTLEQLKQDDPLYWDIYCNGNWGVLDNTNIIIPMKYIIKAKSNTHLEPEGVMVYFGVDVARFGDDSTVIYYRKNNIVQEPITLKSQSVTEVGDKIAEMIAKLKHENYNYIFKLHVDETGVGAGVVDYLRQKNIYEVTVVGINFAQKPHNRDKYEDIATEMMFNVKDILAEQEVYTPSHDRTISELTARTYSITYKGRYKIESKGDYKKRVGRSPDYADAYMLMWYKPKEFIFI